MHIPDGFLTPPIWVTFDLVSASSVAYCVRRVSREFDEKAVPLMGVLAAFIFAAQMINIPVGGGTAGHFLGAALSGSLLGPAAGLTVMTVVLLVQCLLFQDGGIAALGSNIFNMGILGSVIGALIYRSALKVWKGPRRVFIAGFAAGSLTMVLSAFSCATQLVLAGVVSWSTAGTLILGVHAIFALFEGVVTGVVLDSLRRSRPDLFRYNPL